MLTEPLIQEMVLREWRQEVQRVADSGRCFILSKLSTERPKFRSKRLASWPFFVLHYMKKQLNAYILRCFYVF